MNQALIYIGSALAIIWGIAHLFATKPAVSGCGDISRDNRMIITQEWIAEGIAICFTGLLALLVTALEGATDPASLIVYRASAAHLPHKTLRSWRNTSGIGTSRIPSAWWRRTTGRWPDVLPPLSTRPSPAPRIPLASRRSSTTSPFTRNTAARASGGCSLQAYCGNAVKKASAVSPCTLPRWGAPSTKASASATRSSSARRCGCTIKEPGRGSSPARALEGVRCLHML